MTSATYTRETSLLFVFGTSSILVGSEMRRGDMLRRCRRKRRMFAEPWPLTCSEMWRIHEKVYAIFTGRSRLIAKIPIHCSERACVSHRPSRTSVCTRPALAQSRPVHHLDSHHNVTRLPSRARCMRITCPAQQHLQRRCSRTHNRILARFATSLAYLVDLFCIDFQL